MLAQAGCKVVVFEANTTIGGGARSAELTLPGFIHDTCSAVHPFARRVAVLADAAARRARAGMDRAVRDARPSVRRWQRGAGGAIARRDGRGARTRRATPTAGRSARVADDWPRLERAVLGPFSLPRHPFALARFGRQALRSAAGLANSAFTDERTRALFAGIAAHGMLPLDRALTAGVGLALGAMCHVAGWQIAARRRAAALRARSSAI